LVDNFKWNNGFRESFGTVHTDFPTQKRGLKDSAYRYKEVITSKGLLWVYHSDKGITILSLDVYKAYMIAVLFLIGSLDLKIKS